MTEPLPQQLAMAAAGPGGAPAVRASRTARSRALRMSFRMRLTASNCAKGRGGELGRQVNSRPSNLHRETQLARQMLRHPCPIMPDLMRREPDPVPELHHMGRDRVSLDISETPSSNEDSVCHCSVNRIKVTQSLVLGHEADHEPVFQPVSTLVVWGLGWPRVPGLVHIRCHRQA